jgi:mannose-6-phosphate isomerase
MANSDNVLRGGLTQKHVDVPELLRILSFDSGTPQVLDGEPAASPDRTYGTPSDDFELSRIDLATSRHYLGQAVNGPDSIIVLDGGAALTARGQSIPLARGAIVFVPFGTHYSLDARVTRAMLFKASVPGQTDFVSDSE